LILFDKKIKLSKPAIDCPFSFRIPVRIPVEIMQRNIERPERAAGGCHLFRDGIDGNYGTLHAGHFPGGFPLCDVE
jgi:hypothetical protein